MYIFLSVYLRVCSTCCQTSLTLLRATLMFSQHTVPMASAFAGTEVKASFALYKSRAFGSDMWYVTSWPLITLIPPGISAALLHHDSCLRKRLRLIQRLTLCLIHVLLCYTFCKMWYIKWVGFWMPRYHDTVVKQ